MGSAWVGKCALGVRCSSMRMLRKRTVRPDVGSFTR